MIVKLIFVWFKLITEKKNGKNEIVFFSTILIVTRKLDHYVEFKKNIFGVKFTLDNVNVNIVSKTLLEKRK